jgi:hypothetical protein
MNKILNLGIISCIFSILILLSITFWMHFDQLSKMELATIDFVYSIFNSIILFSLGKILVIKYEQTQLSALFKALIIILLSTSLSSIFYQFYLNIWILVPFVLLSVINLTMNIILMNKIMNPDLNHIQKITYLQIYCVSYLLIIIGLFILYIIIELKKIENRTFLIHLLKIIPIIFAGLFLYMTKKEINKLEN